MSLPAKNTSGREASAFDWPAFLVLTIAGSMISMAVTGFVYPTSNNVFHLPIAASLYDEPQYAHDAFIQSLRYYSSGLWLALQGVAKWVEPGYLFFIIAYISRVIYFVGFIACATLLGVSGRKELLLFTALICGAVLLRACSYAGGDNLFSNFCTHSDIASGLFLVALYFAVQGRIAMAITLTGLIFAINLFKGVWVAPALAAVILAQLFGGELSWRQGMVRAAIGICGGSVFAAPVVAALLSNPELGKPLTFNYVAYLSEYFPYHFLFYSNPLKDRIALLFLTLIAGGAFLVIGRYVRPMIVALAAIAAVYVLGAIAPEVTQSPLVLNLHLLRIGGLIQLLSVLAISVLATLWFFSREPAKNVLAALLIAGVLLPSLLKVTIPLTLAIVLAGVADRELKVFKRYVPLQLLNISSSLRVAAILLIIFIIPFVSYRGAVQSFAGREWINAWRQVAVWARDSTSPDSIFLIPAGHLGEEYAAEDEASSGNAIFEVTSHRRIWVDFKRGAAAMWVPSYYHEWHRRITEAASLSTHEDRLQYARQHGVNYVVDMCSDRHSKDAVFSVARLCVYPALSAAQAANASNGSPYYADSEQASLLQPDRHDLRRELHIVAQPIEIVGRLRSLAEE